MLLLDRVIEKATRAKDSRAEELQTIPVYEITSVHQLLTEQLGQTDSPVSRRPPHERLWVEWQEETLCQVVQVGCYLKHSDVLIENVDIPPHYDAVYLLWVYYCIVKQPLIGDPKRDAVIREALHAPCHIPTCSAVVYWNNYHTTKIAVGELDEDYSFGIPKVVLPLDSEDFKNVEIAFWTPAMAFALLNCKNITTDTVSPDAKTQRQVERSGNPPRRAYRVLKVEVPGTKGVPAGEGHSGVHQRLHMCRGHIRELHSGKFVNKQGQCVWVQEHFRGDASLGMVSGRRELHPKEQP